MRAPEKPRKPRERHTTIDFETRSAKTLGGKTGCGSFRYSVDPSTQILCLAWAYPGSDHVYLWHPAYPSIDLPERGRADLEELHMRVACGELIEAHNVFFERCIWNNVGAKRLGWPELKPEQLRCSAAKASAYGLPRKLDNALEALRTTVRKDAAGHKLMQKLTRPRKPKKAEWSRSGCASAEEYTRRFGLLWRENREELDGLFAYNMQDVRTEIELSRLCPELRPEELRAWQMDQAINWRGIRVDVPGVQRAVEIVAHEQARLDEELDALTLGDIPKCTQTKELQAWLTRESGGRVPNLQATTIDALVQQPQGLPPHVVEALRIRREASRTSLGKYSKMLAFVCDGDRVRDILTYCGAPHTGRWCLTGDHEVLTPDGWVALEQWRGGKIACWAPDETASFQDAEALAFDYEGELIEHKSKRIDQLATPDHRMPGWHPRSGAFEVRHATEARNRFHIPYTGSKPASRGVDEHDLRVLVMVQADGHFAEDGQVRLHFSKRRKIERCRRLLRRAGLVFSERENADGTTTFGIRRRHVPLYLRAFRNKTFGWWLLDCDPAVVFDEIEHWDGYRCGPNSIQYSTTNRENAEVIQALAHLSGRAASIVSRRQEEHWSECFAVNIWLTPSNRHELREPPARRSFAGKVYCASTKSGFFYVRRNGVVWVTGNSGAGIQPQNFPRGSLFKCRECGYVLNGPEVCPTHPNAPLDKNKSMPQPEVWHDILTLSIPELAAKYRNLLNMLSHALRGAIIASDGCLLWVADFAQIEARVLFWIAGEVRALEILKSGQSIYKDMSGAIYGIQNPQERVAKGTPQYQIGKQAVLGLGYQMGARKFVITCAGYGMVIEQEMAEQVVSLYRTTYADVPRLWYAAEAAAIRAVLTPGVAVHCKNLTYKRAGRSLLCRLPSGRVLTYMYPEIRLEPTPWGEEKPKLRYWACDSKTKKWTRQHTYGGKLIENAVQAISRDLMRDGMFRAAERGYTPVLTVHDELVTDDCAELGDVKELERILAELPPWAAGCPVEAEGFSGARYSK